MTTDNHRKKAEAKAKTEGSRESLVHLPNGVMVDEAERNQLLLPGVHWHIYQPKIEMVVNEYNIQKALKSVKRNKGAPGVDNMPMQEIEGYLQKHWLEIKESILNGSYSPKPVKRVEIPKPNGNGVRQLGIPTILDRVIQQAIYQVIMPIFDKDFSNNSYGFRPFRNAHQAVVQAHEYLQEGCEWVVDIDLEKFFDRVNHDMLMARVARKIKDKKILLLIRKFLQSGVLVDGIMSPTSEGTPQGGPLSPLLSNILLDDFDKELERRGLRFVRYADDCVPRTQAKAA
jgi:RNA-directed DNA polymerase